MPTSGEVEEFIDLLYKMGWLTVEERTTAWRKLKVFTRGMIIEISTETALECLQMHPLQADALRKAIQQGVIGLGSGFMEEWLNHYSPSP